MNDLLWRGVFTLAIAVSVWLLHRSIGHYPEPWPRREAPGRDLGRVLLLWIVAMVVPMMRMTVFTPWLEGVLTDRNMRELVQLPLLSIPYLALPLLLVVGRNGWTRRELGLTLNTRSPQTAFFALGFGFISGVVPLLSGQAVIGVEPLPLGTLLLLLYNNDFLEEFFHRGVIQSLLERALGQKAAIIWGGVLFGLTHVAFDINRLAASGVTFILFALLLQTLAGWFLGIVYMKTRSLWPGVACHYLANWLPALVKTLPGN
ncbi:MAG: CPBP family intramembrane metalloprotease [Candidatus Aminicenantes bacterium]|nr:CPBP family intramembrane metalloprotease [Candidatus Aminicenantes bacterium]